ncbi:MAG: thiamine phosphate synthase [Pseudomonadota bacterium]
MREKIYLISDRRIVPGGDLVRLLATALADVEPETVFVQLREKDLSGRELHALALEMMAVLRPKGVKLIINDAVDVALAVGADGVHLPEQGLPVAHARLLLGPDRLVGASVHSIAGAVEKARAGADFITIGPIWETPSKVRYGLPLGALAAAEAARVAREMVPRLAVYGLGGVDSLERAHQAMAVGLDGIALVRAAFAAPDPAAAVAALARACTA